MTNTERSSPDAHSERVRWIRRVLVEGLFGRYDYDLSLNPPSDHAGHMILLYGDNGSGKTTLLRIVFHLLNHQDGAGHKTAVRDKAFRRVCIELNDDTRIEAIRPAAQFTGPYELRVSQNGREVASAKIPVPQDDRNDQLAAPLKALADLRIRLFFVTDDRELLTNRPRRGELPDELFGEDQVVYENVDGRLVRISEQLRRRSQVDVAVENALTRATAWAREQVLTGSRQGEADASAIYAQILERLTTTSVAPSEVAREDIDGLATELEAQAERSAEYSEFGIPTASNIGELVQITRRATDAQQRGTVVRVLQPYIETLRARLDALRPTHQSLATFVRTINSFFVDKRLTFNVNKGVEILTTSGAVLAPALLSSGEKQLLLLFSSILAATGPATIVFIDEPELSLNQKWQRRLPKAILGATQGRNIQFVLATHSFEILAQNKLNTVTLKHGGTHSIPRASIANA